MKPTKSWIVLPALLLLAGAASAQDANKDERGKSEARQDTGHYFHLDFVVKEINDGKTTNSRTYSTIVTTRRGENDSIRSGSKVPEEQSTSPQSHQFTYLDVGVNIDCRSLEEAMGRLMLNVSADISSIAPTPAGTSLPPVIRNNRWSSNVVVAVGKPTTIFSSDDVGSKGKIQLELTATPVN